MKKRAILKEQFSLLLERTKKDGALNKESKNKLLAAFTVLFHTGCRIDEIRGFTADTIRETIKNGELIISTPKTKGKRLIRLADESKKALASLTIGGGYLFSSAKRKDEPLSAAAFKRLVNSQIKKVLGEGYSSHSFRAGVATTLCKEGFIKVAQEHLGHKSAATTLIYQRVDESDIISALSKIYA